MSCLLACNVLIAGAACSVEMPYVALAVTFNGAVLSAGKPEFVHQMFEDSKIAVEPDAVVTVTVNVNTLRSSADAQGCSEAKQQGTC